MSPPRYRVLGLARARSAWFRDLSRWSTNAALPVEFVKCMATEELAARLASGQAFSAVIVDGGLPAVDRDLVDRAREVGAAVIVVDDGRRPADWAGMGVDAVLADPFDRADLLSVLLGCAPAIEGPAGDATVRTAPPPAGWRGRLVAVTGPGGAGTSTLAMALAQGLGSAPRTSGPGGARRPRPARRSRRPPRRRRRHAGPPGAGGGPSARSARGRSGAGATSSTPATAATTCCSACAATATGRCCGPGPCRPASTACCAATGWWWPTSIPTWRATTRSGRSTWRSATCWPAARPAEPTWCWWSPRPRWSGCGGWS